MLLQHDAAGTELTVPQNCVQRKQTEGLLPLSGRLVCGFVFALSHTDAGFKALPAQRSFLQEAVSKRRRHAWACLFAPAARG